MSTYVMSDIHGCYNDFIKMLELINFSNNDQLILAGDYIDRGINNLEMLRWIKNSPDNVLLIKGNHDVEFAQCIDIIFSVIKKYNIDVSNLKEKDLFNICNLIRDSFTNDMFDYYGTLRSMFNENDISLKDLESWKQIIDNMPYYYKLSINGKKYIIVHAGYICDDDYQIIKDKYEDKESFYIYSRNDSIRYGGISGSNIIFGHTPTIASGMFYNNGNVYKYVNKRNNCIYYNIDCGISYRASGSKNAKLACIKLDDETIYYV